MKKYGIILFFLLSWVGFASIRDTLNIIPEVDVDRIEKKIQEIHNKREVRVYVNTLEAGEGFQVTDPERTVLLNLNRDKKQVKVQLSFSKDIDLEEEEDQINLILENASPLLVSGKPGEYVYQVLDGVEYLLENAEITDPGDVMQQSEEKSEFKKGLMISFAVILLLASKIAFDLWKKKKEKNKKT